jgi:hypothetical protein
MTDKMIRKLPAAEALSRAVEAYFERCAAQGTPPTPSALALELGVRTSMLSDERLTAAQRAVLDYAMQRIEASTMELLLTRGGVKGIESVLERVSENDDGSKMRAELRRMSDEEIKARLKKLLPKLQKAIEE